MNLACSLLVGCRPCRAGGNARNNTSIITDRIEREGEDFHRTVDRAYRELATMFPDRIMTVDGEQPAEQIAEEIRGRIRELS